MNLVKRERCSACGASEFSVLLSVPYEDPQLLQPLLERYRGEVTLADLHGGKYELALCRSCTHVFQTYVPNDVLATRIYSFSQERIPESLKKRTHAPLPYYEKNALRVETMGALLARTPHDVDVLDVGGGWGYFLLMAKAFGFSVCGVELSPERRTHMESLGIPNVSNLDDLETRKFDYVHMDQVLEHVSDPFSFLQSSVKHAHSGGLVYVSVPNGRLIAPEVKSGKINLLRKSAYPLEHINCFTHASLVALARRSGLVPLSPREVVKRLIRGVSIRDNAHLLQAALLQWYRYRNSTDLYFSKI
jgi:2-polyprenyl-3-methyl-5-hydroxy-6-metoxy-1,4-benzoquinol methylase